MFARRAFNNKVPSGPARRIHSPCAHAYGRGSYDCTQPDHVRWISAFFAQTKSVESFEGGQVIPLNRLASLAQLPDVGAIMVAGGHRTHLELN